MKRHAIPASIRYDEQCSLGPSPSVAEIEWLARHAGVRALLNLNEEGEAGQALSPNVEASWAHTHGMEQERVSIPLGPIDGSSTERFLRTLEAIAKPVYVHSAAGDRAAAMMTIHLGLTRGLGGAEAERTARSLGLAIRSEALLRSSIAEVDRQRAPAPVPAAALASAPAAPALVTGSQPLASTPS